MARNVCPEPAEEPARQGRFSIREILPPHDPGSWPQGFTVSREQIYDDMARLTGDPRIRPATTKNPCASAAGSFAIVLLWPRGRSPGRMVECARHE